jgi:deazaflavin-dependent oxidoreductase (nitroreductase family)
MKAAFKRNFSRRLIDAVASAAIRRGVGPSQRYLLTVVGRRTGTLHTTPVSLVIDGSTRYLVGSYGEVGWVHNARESGVVTLARGGRSERYSVTPLQGSEAAAVLRRYLKLEPITRPYFTASADAPEQAFEGEVRTHPVFKLEPAT